MSAWMTGQCKIRHNQDKSQNLSRYKKLAPNAGFYKKQINPSQKKDVFRDIRFTEPARQTPFCAPFRNALFKGSMTLEAAFVLPLLLFFLCSFLYLTLLVGLQVRMQRTLDEVTGQMVMLQGASGVNSTIEERLSLAAAKAIARTRMSGYAGLVTGGSAGFDFSESYVSEESQDVGLIVRYEVSIPAPLLGSPSFSFTQTSCRRIWSGSEGTSWKVEADKESEERSEETVYITPTGTVYHLYEDCTYLQPSVRKASVLTLSEERSEDGSIYYRCPACRGVAMGAYVYVTDYGNRYHTSLSCRQISRTVQEGPLSEVKGRGLCSKCRDRSGK